jgi:hypothetical protein
MLHTYTDTRPARLVARIFQDPRSRVELSTRPKVLEGTWPEEVEPGRRRAWSGRSFVDTAQHLVPQSAINGGWPRRLLLSH